MNQNRLKQSFIARAKTLAHVMTRSTNVKVTVSGNTAYNTAGLINIPAGDFTDKEWVKMVEGWIDHELGHENHTDNAVRDAFVGKSKLKHALWNIIEDVWMERSVGNRFPGARQNLSILAELAMKRGLFEDPAGALHPLTAVSAFLLYGGRSKIIGQHCLDNYADNALTEVINHLGDDFAKKLVICRDDIGAVNSTAGAVAIAQRVIDLLKEEKDNQEQQQEKAEKEQSAGKSNDDADTDSDDNQPGDTDDDADADSDDSQPGDADDDADADSDDSQPGDADDDADSDDNQPGDADDDADADSDDSQPGDTDDDADADSDDSQPGDTDDDADADSDDSQPGDADDDAETEHPGKPTPQQILDAIERTLNQADKAEIHDFHEALAEMLGEQAEESKADKEIREVSSQLQLSAVNGSADYFVSGSHMLDQMMAKRLSGGVYQTMHKVLFDQVQSLEINRKVGSKLVNRRLSGIPAGNLSVFSRRAETQDVSAAVEVIIDCSGSMGFGINGNPPAMPFANACAYAFALGLNKSGVSSEFVYYGPCLQEGNAMYTAKSFTEKPVASRFAVASGGYTPTGHAMQYALSSLVLRPELKKLLIVLTDGQPDNAEHVRQATALAKAFGVKVIPIGIQTTCVDGFDEGEFVTVQTPEELTTALRHAVKMKLFK
ncbi:VWA domain-containing protein [Rheinheimera sp.]|uniref:VWA domain-containing protein n=1 Tax=Rheinheimera sp. TaxID=1869214 RepID=UPI0040484771